jgi:CheY-like chemotaxis protein
MDESAVGPPSLLVVEDNPNDLWFLRRALTQVAPRITLNAFTDGRTAIEYLSQFVMAPSRPRPFLMLLDVHLPRLSGWDVLRWVKGHAVLGAIPAMMWTSLPNPEGAARSRDLGADQYFSKPLSQDGYVQIAGSIASYLGD